MNDIYHSCPVEKIVRRMQGVLSTGELLVSMTFALIGWLKTMLEKLGWPCHWCRVAIRYVLAGKCYYHSN